MNDKSKYIVNFSNCIPVKGAARSIICDTQRQNYTFVPNELIDLFFQNKPLTLNDLLKVVDKKYHTVLKEYYDFLLKHEFIFLCDKDEIPLFPKTSLKWVTPSIITNIIIDIKNEIWDFNSIAKQLTPIGCRDVQIRFFKNYDINKYLEILEVFENSCISSIELYIPFNRNLTYDKLKLLVEKYKRIKILVVYNSTENKLMKSVNNINMGAIYYFSENILSEINCGCISRQYFSVTIEHFSEAQQHNTCLNRKLSIDSDGNIKNCTSMKEFYGNIKGTTLEEAINKKGFKKYWKIKKDDIAVCKDCEFRYICTDCRAYLETPEDVYSKPLKCGYNPYTNKWEDWSANPLKKKAIEYYKMPLF